MTEQEIRDKAPSGATHISCGRYVKKLRENKHKSDVAAGYLYAYDFWDGKRWNGCVCKAHDFFKIKPL